MVGPSVVPVNLICFGTLATGHATRCAPRSSSAGHLYPHCSSPTNSRLRLPSSSVRKHLCGSHFRDVNQSAQWSTANAGWSGWGLAHGWIDMLTIAQNTA